MENIGVSDIRGHFARGKSISWPNILWITECLAVIILYAFIEEYFSLLTPATTIHYKPDIYIIICESVDNKVKNQSLLSQSFHNVVIPIYLSYLDACDCFDYQLANMCRYIISWIISSNG